MEHCWLLVGKSWMHTAAVGALCYSRIYPFQPFISSLALLSASLKTLFVSTTHKNPNTNKQKQWFVYNCFFTGTPTREWAQPSSAMVHTLPTLSPTSCTTCKLSLAQNQLWRLLRRQQHIPSLVAKMTHSNTGKKCIISHQVTTCLLQRRNAKVHWSSSIPTLLSSIWITQKSQLWTGLPFWSEEGSFVLSFRKSSNIYLEELRHTRDHAEKLMVLHCETVTGKTQENSSKVHLGHFRSSLSTCLNFTEGFFPLQIPQCTAEKKKKGCRATNHQVKIHLSAPLSLVAAHPHLCKSFGWFMKPFCSSASHTNTFQTPLETSPAPSGHVCVSNLSPAWERVSVWDPALQWSCLGTRAGSDLQHYFHLYNNKDNSEAIWEHREFHALLRVSCNITDYYPSIFVREVWKKEEGLLEIGF